MKKKAAVSSGLMALVLCVANAPSASAMDFFYVGPSGGSFFDTMNWNDAPDGSGAFLATPVIDGGTNLVEHSLVIDGDSVLAGTGLSFGMGSLSLGLGSALTVSGNDLIFGSGSSLTSNGASLIVNGAGDNGQVQFNLGSTVSLTDTTLTATDDLFFRGSIAIADSMLESRQDDIEFQSDASIVSITGSDFLASGTGAGGGLNQVIYFRTSTDQVFDSTFRAGRFGVVTDGVGTTTDVKMTDSSIHVDGDIDNIFASSDGGVHRLTLAGDSSTIADQLQIVAMFLQDSSSATFTDDADADGDTWLTNNALVRLDSLGASVTFEQSQLLDARSRVFDGINLTTYALSPGNFSPSDWDGMSAATIRLIPEPSTIALAALGCGLLVSGRRLA